MDIPEELRYTTEHEWVAERGDGTVRIGITAFAAEALGDVVFVQLPSVGAAVRPGDSFGEVESTKSVSDVYAPLTGTVAGVNDALDGSPELVSSDPYGEGWLVELSGVPAGHTAELLDAAAYRVHVGPS